MTLKEQFFILIIILSSSFGIGILFDGYRVLLNKLNVTKWVTLICDIFFGVLSAVFIFQLLLWSNNGQLRLIILIAFFIGLMLYYLSLSKEIVVLWVYCFNIIYKIIKVICHLMNTLIIKPLTVTINVIILVLKKVLLIVNPIIFILKKLNKIFNAIVISRPKNIVKKKGFLTLLKKLFKKK